MCDRLDAVTVTTVFPHPQWQSKHFSPPQISKDHARLALPPLFIVKSGDISRSLRPLLCVRLFQESRFPSTKGLGSTDRSRPWKLKTFRLPVSDVSSDIKCFHSDRVERIGTGGVALRMPRSRVLERHRHSSVSVAQRSHSRAPAPATMIRLSVQC